MKVRTKFILLFLPIAAGSAWVMAESSRRAIQDVIEGEVVRHGVSVLQTAAEDPVLVEAFESAEENRLLGPLSAIVEHSGARYAAAIAPDGRVLAHTILAERGSIDRLPATTRALGSSAPVTRRLRSDGEPLVEVSVPVWRTAQDSLDESFLLFMRKDRPRLGILRFGISLQGSHATSARISRQVSLVVVIVGAVSLALMLVVIHWVLAPVPALLAATRRIGAGSFGETVQVASRDEIGELAGSINQMSRSLAQTTVSREFLNTILAGMQDALAVIEPDGTIRLANRALLGLLGYQDGDLVGRDASILVPPGPSLLDASPDNREHELMKQDGTTVPVLMGLVRLPGGSAEAAWVLTAKDITPRKRAEAELKHSLSVLRETLEATADGILVVSGDHRIVCYNRRFGEMMRIPESVLDAGDEEVALSHVRGQVEDPESFVAQIRKLDHEPDAQTYDLLKFKDGRLYERYSKPQRMEGVSVGRVWSVRDISDRVRTEQALKQSEEQLRQAQKMEAVGTLAGGIAHDFNNLLTGISGYCQLLLMRHQAGDRDHANLTEIRKASDKAAALTRQLLSFSRKQIIQPSLIDLNTAVREVDDLLRRLIGEDVEIVTELRAGTGVVLADRGQIEQVVVNLAVNARDAMPTGGTLTIRTWVADVDSTEAGARRIEPGRYAVLSMTDTGCGMDPAAQARMFEPFFTTKAPDKGTGLGLSMVYAIVKQSGGAIGVTSAPGQGTSLDIFLPQVREVIDASPEPKEAGPLRGSETILLVEDEATVRELVRQTLVTNGYTVLTAGDGQEGLEVARRHRGPIHLLVTDVVMPRMGGGPLAQRLCEIRPDMLVLFVSGYADDAVVRHGVQAGGQAFLQKPFNLMVLVSKVRELLDAPLEQIV